MAVRWISDTDAHLQIPAGTLVMLAGVPGSGKSTLGARCGPEVKLLEADAYRAAVQIERGLPEHAYHKECVPEARRRFLADLEDALEAGDSTVVEAALLSEHARQELIDAAGRHRRSVQMVIVHATLQECLAGVQCRSRTVPTKRLHEFWAMWETLRAQLQADGGLAAVTVVHVLDRAAAQQSSIAFV